MSSRSSDHTKLRTNAALTKEAETEVRRAMGRTLKKLGAVEMEIAGLQDRLVVLGQRKQDTKSFIEAHQRLLSPIRQLLPEILQEIFWQCLPVAHNSVLSAKEAPLVLGRVCSQWRRIAYSTPKLWCSLHIAIPPLTYSRAQAIFEAYEAWIARSGILPLSISISDAKQLEVSKDQFRPYFELITLHTRRWRSIYFQVPFGDKLDFLAEIDGDRFPLLEGFHVDRGYFGNLAMVDHLLSRKDGILSAPLLRVLSISRISLGTLDLPVQWSLLTGLNLSYANLQECFELLTLCLNLEMCTLYDVGRSHHSFSNSQSSNKSRPNIVLSKLQTLEIVGELRQDDTSWILLDNLATPALRCFVYRTFEGQDLSPTDLLLSIKVFRLFFQRLNQPLEELQLNVSSSMATFLTELLSLVPSLKRLSLLYPSTFYGSPCGDCMLLGFIPSEHKSHHHSCSSDAQQIDDHESNSPSSSTCLCPNLKVLNIDNVSISKHVLLEYLRSRLVDYEKYNVAPLRRFNVSFNLKPEDETMTAEEIAKIDGLCKEAGLLVKFEPSDHLTAPKEPPPSSFGEYFPSWSSTDTWNMSFD